MREDTDESIGVIGVPTADRPFELDRMLKSFVQNVTHYGRTPEFVISDGSQEENLRANAETINTKEHIPGK